MAIRSDEITSIIRNEIKEFDAGADVTGVGTIVEAGDGIARSTGCPARPRRSWSSSPTVSWASP